MASIVDNSPYFIAEVSSNHQSSLERCIEFVDLAANLGFDAVKFQLFEVEKLFSKEAFHHMPELKQRKDWELPYEFIPNIRDRCKLRGIEFGCTPFDLGAADFLSSYVDFYKVASYELLWHDLIKKCASYGIDTIISTGMATLDEVSASVDAFKTKSNKDPYLMHCNSNYPMNIKEANLSAIDSIRDKTNCMVGWSDHSVSSMLVVMAIIKYKASCIEIHIDIDGDGDEFSSGHCWLPEQAKDLISFAKNLNEIDGDGRKAPSLSEEKESFWRADPIDGLRPLLSKRLELEK